ncbi:t-SNARE [Clavulina sp. PMI_390]|nr:t-SNARE [Clavulina sp. PMI_390]
MQASTSTQQPEPTTRSRTLLFLSYRDSSSSRVRRRPRGRAKSPTSYYSDAPNYADTAGGERQGLINGAEDMAGHSGLDDAALPPMWVDISEQVEEILEGTALKVSSLDKLHAKHALPGFTDRSAEEREIEMMTSDITRDFRKCQSLIKRITPDSPAHSFPPSSVGPSSNEIKAANNVQRALAAKVQEMSGTFRKKQRVYMDKLQGHATKNRDLLIASGTIPLTASEQISEVDDDIEASRGHLSAQQMENSSAVNIETRTRELNEIAKSISQLAEVFKDLQAMVIDQGTILDSIEYNIEQTAVHVQEAVKELKVATKYQKNTGRRMLIFLLILVIFGLVLILIFKPRRTHSSPTPPSLPPPQSPEAGS